MRKLNWMGMAMMAILMSMNFFSCSQENDAVLPEQPTEEYVTVNLGVTGEYLELSESPLGTRAEDEGKDVIGIQVYDVTDYSSTPHAYGKFLTLENTTIRLLQGHEYKFIVSILIDGCKCTDIENSGHNLEICGSFNDEFTYSATEGHMIHSYGGKEEDAYYGELEGYTPTEDGTVEIATKRTVYGVHYIAEDLAEGKLTIKAEPLLYDINLTSDIPEHEGIYTFSDIKNAWEGLQEQIGVDSYGGPIYKWVDYYTTKRLIISWTKDDGLVLPLGEYDVTFKRNVKTTIRIKVKDQSDIINGIIITREEAAMTDDENEYVIEVEDGTITEVPVTTVP